MADGSRELEVGQERAGEAAQRYPHLRPRAASLVEASAEARIDDINRDRWLGYPAATALLEEIQNMMRCRNAGTMPNMMIVSPSRNGKTAIIERIKALNPPQRRSDGKLDIPVVQMDMPADTRTGDFYFSLCKALLVDANPNASTKLLSAQAYDALDTTAFQLLVIDEFHNLLTAREKRAIRALLGAIKNYSNRLSAPIIALGTETAIPTLARDSELLGRFEIAELPRWEYGEAFLKFLQNLEMTLPFPEPSDLASPDKSRKLFEMSDGGILAWFIRRIQKAAVRAVEDGAPHITMEHLKGVRLRSLEEMRRLRGL